MRQVVVHSPRIESGKPISAGRLRRRAIPQDNYTSRSARVTTLSTPKLPPRKIRVPMITAKNTLIVQFPLNISKYKTTRFIVDTGAEISLHKAEATSDSALIYENQRCTITTLAGDVIPSLGISYGSLILNVENQNLMVEHPFHVIPDGSKLPCDGLLGSDFLTKYNCSLNCSEGYIEMELYCPLITKVSKLSNVNNTEKSSPGENKKKFKHEIKEDNKCATKDTEIKHIDDYKKEKKNNKARRSSEGNNESSNLSNLGSEGISNNSSTNLILIIFQILYYLVMVAFKSPFNGNSRSTSSLVCESSFLPAQANSTAYVDQAQKNLEKTPVEAANDNIGKQVNSQSITTKETDHTTTTNHSKFAIRDHHKDPSEDVSIKQPEMRRNSKQEITQSNNLIRLLPRCENVITLPTCETKEVICEQKEIQPGVIIGNTLAKPNNREIKVLVLNSNDNEIYIPYEKVKPTWSRLEDYDVIEADYEKDPITNRLKNLETVLKLQHCNKEEKQSILDICRQYNDLFYLEGDLLTYTDAATHSIQVKSDTAPIHVKPYRLPVSQRDEINRQINDMLDQGIVSPSKSPWNSPLLLVPKKPDETGKKRWRVVVDFRRLNEATLGDAYPLPNITDILDQLGRSKYFTTLDLANGFHQIPMNEKDKEKTAFSTPFGHYHYNRMPFGLKGAPATFQRLMNSALSGLQGLHCFVYLDDIVIYGYNLKNHNTKLVQVLERLRIHHLKLQPDKCHFLQKEIVYLGHIVGEHGVQPDQSKISAVKTYPTPKKPKDVKAFLGFVGYYRRFIPNFSQIAKPLTNLLKKDMVFKWDSFCDESFKLLKSKLISAPILAYPEFDREFNITTDASDVAVGAVLSQGEVGKDRPICYASRTLNNAETRYSTIEKELLAIVYAVEQFRPYIYGRRFTIVTDHKPLVWLMKLKDPTSRLMRWRIKLEEYDYFIIHKPGTLNANADALSRIIPDDANSGECKTINVITRSQAKVSNSKLSHLSRDDLYNNFITTPLVDKNALIERRGHLLNEKAIQYKFFLLPKTEDQTEMYLKDIIPKLAENLEVGKVGEHTIKNQTYIITKTNIPMRTANDSKQVLRVLHEFKEYCKRHNLAEIHISLPNLDLITLSEIKSMINFTFQDPNFEINLFITRITILTNPDEQRKVIELFHESPLGGHQGITRTIKRIQTVYSWPGMNQDIENYIKKCPSCQTNKLNRNPKIPMKITTTSVRPFERVALDIVGPLPISHDGNRYLLTFQDDLTKYTEAIPLRNAEARSVAEAFVTNIVCKHGIPDSLLTDQGTNFVSEMFTQMCKLLKIRKLQSTPYHPQTNGALERSHRTLAEYLRHYVNRDPLTWDTWIPYAVFVYNTSPHSSTNFSPYELLYGFPPNIPSVVKSNPVVHYNYENYSNEIKARLQHSYQIARENLLNIKDKYKRLYDRGSKTKTFNLGDKVLLKNNIRKNKLSPLWTGPYEVIKINTTENSTIKIGNKSKIIHNNNLKLFVE